MCQSCFRELIYKFDTYHEFEDFEKVLQQKCIAGTLKIIDRHETDALAVYDSYLYYRSYTIVKFRNADVSDRFKKYFTEAIALDKFK